MTCYEKLRVIRQDYSEDDFAWTTQYLCPSDFDIMEDPEYCCGLPAECKKCWSREVDIHD